MAKTTTVEEVMEEIDKCDKLWDKLSNNEELTPQDKTSIMVRLEQYEKILRNMKVTDIRE